MSDFINFEALSFDCYGTLIDWETGIANELLRWTAKHEFSISREQLLVDFSDYEATAEREFPGTLYPEILTKSMAGLSVQYGIEASAEDLATFGDSVQRWPAFPDSAEALTLLKQKFKLIILSNVDRNSFAESNKKLGVKFDAIITAQDVGAYKPRLDGFHKLAQTCKELGVTEGGLLHVAQSLFHDHVPAKQVGLQTVWINRRHNDPGWGATPVPQAEVTPEWTFNSMIEFAKAATS
jgi:putative hydrolase of the HAD superfamily